MFVGNVGNWKEAIIETKRQYEAIDRALEVRVWFNSENVSS